MPDLKNISRQVLIINILLSQLVLLLAGAGLTWFIYLRNGINITDFFLIKDIRTVLIYSFGGSTLLIIIQLLFIKLVSMERLHEEINILIFEKLTYIELLFVFLLGAAIEEFLFRLVIQQQIGIILTSIIFVVVHVRYLKKVFVIIEVFLLSFILGYIFIRTGIIWPSVVSHFTVNYVMAVMAKKGIIPSL